MCLLPRKRFALPLLLLCGLPVLSSCVALGVAASKMPPATVLPKYERLANQSVGVMVWCDQGLKTDWNSIHLDLANSLQKRLQSSKDRQLKGATFPFPPASMVRWQHDHPEDDGSPITMIAPRLGVSRLIYIELEDFTTRSDLSVDLFRGSAKATVKVVEVEGGKANVAYTEQNIAAAFPSKAPREGLPGAGDYKIYAGTIDALAAQISKIFLRHPEEE
jgi:hypothetical protein